MAILVRPASILVAGVALATAVGLSAAPALAAGKTWTISPGGAISAKAKNATVTDTTSGNSLTCKSSTMKGKLKAGKKLAGKAAGTVSGFTITGCSIEGQAITVKPSHLPWKLNLVSYNKAKGVTTATLTGIHIKITVAALGCSAIVDGTKSTADNGMITVTYTNKTGVLKTQTKGGNLKLYGVTSGCLGVINSGDKVALGASYTVTKKQKITSP
ncbi:MAG TPA: hypothetical protein VHU92_15825 [Streptosporangiaceae bacterium]|jgi:hypothetical protein|nr:hypothetical protein [Streptosporangiaceae bacterium]